MSINDQTDNTLWAWESFLAQRVFFFKLDLEFTTYYSQLTIYGI